jgi:hypothetical protein
MRAQPVAMPGSVDSRTWLMANRSMSWAHAPETAAVTSKSAVPEVNLASITLASPCSLSWYTPAGRGSAPGARRSKRARERCYSVVPAWRPRWIFPEL